MAIESATAATNATMVDGVLATAVAVAAAVTAARTTNLNRPAISSYY